MSLPQREHNKIFAGIGKMLSEYKTRNISETGQSEAKVTTDSRPFRLRVQRSNHYTTNPVIIRNRIVSRSGFSSSMITQQCRIKLLDAIRP